VKTFWNQARLTYAGAKHRVNLDAGWKSVQDDFIFNKASIANQNKSKIMQLTMYDEWRPVKNTILIGGIQLINKVIRSNDRGDHNIAQAGGFVILNQSFNNFTINPALRLDWNEKSGVELVPQVNLSWKLKQWQLRASAGKTIRDADFTERFNNYNKAIVTSGRIGDPALNAERSFSYEVGVDYFHTGAVKISGTFFQRLHKRLIDYAPTPYADMPRKDNLVPTGTYALAKNIASVTTTGGELDIQSGKSFGNGSSLFAGAGLVWLYSESSEATPSFYVTSHARFLSNFYIDFKHRRFFIGANGIYKTRNQQASPAIQATISKDYFVLNTKAGLYILRERLNIFTQINNIFNVAYSDLLGSKMPGRWFIAGIGIDFRK
jgi:vitamin B12 transporter